MLYMIFRSGVKNQAKEFSFFNYFNRSFPPKNVRVQEKSILLVKMYADRLWDGKLKAILGCPIWMLLTHSCIALSSMFKVLPCTHKVAPEQGAIRTLQDSFNDINFDAQ